MNSKNKNAKLHIGETFYVFKGNIFKPIDVTPPCFCVYACASPMIISSMFAKSSTLIALIPPNNAVNIDCGQTEVLVLYLNPQWASVLLDKIHNVVTDFEQHTAQLFLKIYHHLENPCVGNDLELLERLLDRVQTTLSRNKDLDQRTIQAISMLEDNSDVNFMISDIAKELGLSLGGFCNFFKRKTGMPARRFRMWVRCVRVVKSVGFKGDPTESVMNEGFSDYAQFSRAFKTFVGTSPCTIRSQYNEVDITQSV